MKDEEIEAYKQYIIRQIQESFTRICMAYDCECGERIYFVIDRFPMSYKIGFECKSCKKFDFRKIVEPFVYWSEMLGEIASPKDILFTDPTDPQKMLLMQHIEFEKEKRSNDCQKRLT